MQSDSQREKLEKRKAFVEKYSLAKLRWCLEEVEKILVLSLPLKLFTTAYVEEVYDSMVQFIEQFPNSVDKTLWNAHKVEMKKEISKVEADPEGMIVPKVPYHYNLWRVLLEYSEDWLMVSMKARYASEESRRQVCARIASLYLFDGSDDTRVPEKYDLNAEEVIEGLKKKLGINDAYLFELVKALFDNLNFPGKRNIPPPISRESEE